MTKPNLPRKTWVPGHKPSSLPRVDRNRACVFLGAVADTGLNTWAQLSLSSSRKKGAKHGRAGHARTKHGRAGHRRIVSERHRYPQVHWNYSILLMNEVNIRNCSVISTCLVMGGCTLMTEEEEQGVPEISAWLRWNWGALISGTPGFKGITLS
jgi:hypothetical protein